MKTANQPGQLDEIQLAQVVLITSTSRLLDAADDVKRKRDHLLELLQLDHAAHGETEARTK